MLKNRIQYLILLLFIVGLYIFTNQYFTFILLLFFIILPSFSFLFLILSYRGVSARFEIPPVIRKAEAAAITFTLESTSFFPVSGAILHILCRNNLTGKENDTKIFCAAGNKKAGRASFMLTDINAGQISVILKKIRVCDIFGLFCLSQKVCCEKNGLIYPETYDVKITMENQEEINGDGERYSQTKKGQDVNELFALREYTPGDEIRKIHWKLSAKQGKLVVRDFALPMEEPVFLLLEISNDKKGNSDEILDACMMTFVSVSRSLIEMGIFHNIAWFDSASNKLIVKEIESKDALEADLPELLSIRSYSEDALALRYYEAGSYCNTGLFLYYITTKINPEEIAGRALYQTVKTIYITDEKNDGSEDSNITAVTPQNIKADIESIII